ncbi:hypothetical protein LPJ74_006105, partial [Coemansia sp. RSA 1843]
LHRQAHVRSAAILAVELACIEYLDIRNPLWLTLLLPPLILRASVPFFLTPMDKSLIFTKKMLLIIPILSLPLTLLPVAFAGHSSIAIVSMPRVSYGVLLAVDFCLFSKQLVVLFGGTFGSWQKESSFLSRVTYFWVFQYVSGKYRKQKDNSASDDIEELPTRVGQTEAFDLFTRNWHSEAQKDSSTLAKTIVKTFAKDLCFSSVLQLAVYVSQVGLPVLVSRILHHLSHEEAGDQLGAFKSLAIYAVASIAAVLIEQNQIDLRDKIALKINVTLTTATHHTVLCAPPSVQARGGSEVYTTGVHHTRMLSTHIVKLCGNVWIPVRVFGGLYVFYRQVGWWAVVPGISFIFLYLPLRSVLIQRRTKAQGEMARATAGRIELLVRMIENIVPLRLLGWDHLLADRVQGVREREELEALSAVNVTNSLLMFTRASCMSCGPIMSLFIYSVAIQSFGGSSSDGAWVTAEQVYVVQAILRELFPLVIDVPHAFDSWWSAKPPYAQITRILLNNNRHDRMGARCASGTAVSIEGGNFAWHDTNEDQQLAKFVLKDVNLTALRGQLICVVGKAGSGKSSLLSAILGEMPPQEEEREEGEEKAKGGSSSSVCVDAHQKNQAIGIVPQSAWLMGGKSTVRDNITLGLAYDSQWFQRVIDACDLAHDLAHQWPLGENTMVGSNGAMISGGQRMRIALARSVYSRAPLHLLDDVLSMVDAHVGNRIIKNVLCGKLLQGTTRIVVSNNHALLSKADAVWVVANGTVRAVQPSSVLFSSYANVSMEEEAISVSITPESLDNIPVAAAAAAVTPPSSNSALPLQGLGPQEKKPTEAPHIVKAADSKYIEPVRYMLRLCGWAPVLAHIVTVALQCVASRNAQLWITKRIPLLLNAPEQQQQQQEAPGRWAGHPMHMHFLLCTLWWASDVGLDFAAQLWTDVVWRRAIFVKSHRHVLRSVFNAPLLFFHGKTSTGQLLELFTRSQTDVDTHMPQQVASVATFGVKLLFESWVIVMFHPVLVAAMGAVIGAMWLIMRATREPLAGFISQINDALPLVDHQFHESTKGIATLRALNQQEYAHQNLTSALDRYARAQRAQDSVETWIDLTMALLREGANIVAFAIALTVRFRSSGTVDPALMSLVNLCVTFHLARLQHLIRHSHTLRTSLAKAARYIRFTQIESESQCTSEWRPTRGEIVFDRVCARYSDHSLNSTWALNEMSFHVMPGQHIGVVGRTGAGKTSIAMALFGLLVPDSGSILIDGCDIHTTDLRMLRSCLSIVPQDPQTPPHMTVRDNLDPLHRSDTKQLESALSAVGLCSTRLDESPELWSVGQKQLLALARALLKRSPLLVLDEATAHIGADESATLHTAICRHFAHCTVITIAHRLEAVMHCHRVLVVRDGYVCESGAPRELLAQQSSLFAKLAQISKPTCAAFSEQSSSSLFATVVGPPTPPEKY